MTQSTGERIYRACVRCRARKVKCDLRSVGEAGKPPCIKCHDEGFDCQLGTSRRGGDYSHYRRSTRTPVANTRRRGRAAPSSWLAGTGTSRSEPNSAQESNGNEPGIQNPLEALELLAKVAAKENGRIQDEGVAAQLESIQDPDGENAQSPIIVSGESINAPIQPTDFENLDTRTLTKLLESYYDTYHTFLPVVPRHIFSVTNISRTVREEPFVLTAVILIATKDRPEYSDIHCQMWTSMQKMLLGIVLGAREVRTVGCVEGLLVLAEWVPHANANAGYLNVSEKGTGGLAGTEDTAAWTLVGLAVRQAYLLHLDKCAFRGESLEEENVTLYRNRLAWTYTYIADRQISIRMGQAFWCRGPSLATKYVKLLPIQPILTAEIETYAVLSRAKLIYYRTSRFTASDFPTLLPRNPYEDDYASVLQSQLELTVLFGNVHDLLYASKPRSISLMLAGDYIKYLDDSMQGLAAWKQAWRHLDVGQHLKLVLDLQYEYLRLYIHGFAFQAAISRAPSTPPSYTSERPMSRFTHGVLATPDGRHILLAITAAKSVLGLLAKCISPSKHLRFLGPRFYLYAIHSAVFLFKAASYGAIGPDERQECVEIIKNYIAHLAAAASCESHIAARHSTLLTCLWLGKQTGRPTDAVPATSEEVNQDANHTYQGLSGSSSALFADLNQGRGHGSLIDPAAILGQYGPRQPGCSNMAPESFVTDLYGLNQQSSDLDIFSCMDFGAYGEPDLRNLISM